MKPLVSVDSNSNNVRINPGKCYACDRPGIFVLTKDGALAMLYQLSVAVKEIEKREAEGKEGERMKPLASVDSNSNNVRINPGKCYACDHPGSFVLSKDRALAMLYQLSVAVKEIEKREAEAKQGQLFTTK